MSSRVAASRARARRLQNYPNPPPILVWEQPVWVMMKCMAGGLGPTPSAAQKQAATELFQALPLVIPHHHKTTLERPPISSSCFESSRHCYDWVIQMQRQTRTKRRCCGGVSAAEKLENYPEPPPRHQWGPALWIVMKTIAASLGTNPGREQQHAARDFFHALCELLACGHCRTHYTKLIMEVEPLRRDCLSNGKACYDWVLRIEEHVIRKIAASSGQQR